VAQLRPGLPGLDALLGLGELRRGHAGGQGGLILLRLVEPGIDLDGRAVLALGVWKAP